MLATHFGGLSSLLQQKTLVYVGSPLKVEEGVDIAPGDRLADTDDAQRYVTCFTFDRLHWVILNFNLYSEGN